MAKIKLALAEGGMVEVEGRKFKYSVGGESHWFAVHKSNDVTNRYDVTHVATGKRATQVPYMAIFDYKGDHVAAAKHALGLLVAKYGEARVRSVLAGA